MPVSPYQTNPSEGYQMKYYGELKWRRLFGAGVGRKQVDRNECHYKWAPYHFHRYVPVWKS